jgi:hypothetical protein
MPDREIRCHGGGLEYVLNLGAFKDVGREFAFCG